jgi:hypothetical protein
MKTLLSILIVIISFTGFSQSPFGAGYFGRKVSIDLGGYTGVRLIDYLDDSRILVNENNQLVEGFKWFNNGFRAAVSYTPNNRISYGVELQAGRYFWGGTGDQALDLDGYQVVEEPGSPNDTVYQLIRTYVYNEARAYRTFLVMPNIDLAVRRQLSKLGLTHQFAVGLSFNQRVDRDYLDEINVLIKDSQGNPLVINPEELSSYDGSEFYPKLKVGFCMAYTAKITRPISERWLWYFGFRYSLNASGMYNVRDIMTLQGGLTFYL